VRPVGDGTRLSVLVVDDEQPVCDELAYLLDRDPRVGRVRSSASGAEALLLLEASETDVVFLDIAMPGISGVDLARVLARFRAPPRVVFVTAHDEHAVDAFDLHAVDYLLKPVHPERLTEAVRRVVADLGDQGVPPAPRAGDGAVVGVGAPVDALGPAADRPPGETTGQAGGEATGDDVISVERAGVTRFVSRSEVAWVEAHGDYARLHTAEGEHLVRVPLSTLAQRWAGAGFLRVHRSLLVDTRRVIELRTDGGRTSIVVPGLDGPVELRVARRHSRELRDVLVRRSRP